MHDLGLSAAGYERLPLGGRRSLRVAGMTLEERMPIRRKVWKLLGDRYRRLLERRTRRGPGKRSVRPRHAARWAGLVPLEDRVLFNAAAPPLIALSPPAPGYSRPRGSWSQEPR